jgi:hypothetical protein
MWKPTHIILVAVNALSFEPYGALSSIRPVRMLAHPKVPIEAQEDINADRSTWWWQSVYVGFETSNERRWYDHEGSIPQL